MAYENYKSNVDVYDKYGVKDIIVSKRFVCSNHQLLIRKKEAERKGSHSLASAIIGLNNIADIQSVKQPDIHHCWTDIDAQELYLISKPTCYLIIGKPGIGVFSLGEAIAKELNCIHLSPRIIITDEIDQGSSSGKCMDFNMRHNKIIRSDVIMSLLKKKIESAAVQHRGYVISGFPIVTASSSSRYLIESLNAEESVLTVEQCLHDFVMNLKKKKSKKLDTERAGSDMEMEENEEQTEEGEEEQLEEAVEEEEEDIVVQLPKFLLNTCTEIIFSKKSYINTTKATLLNEIADIFNIAMKPDIIIYVTCPDTDAITKKMHKYIDYKNKQPILDPFVFKRNTEIRLPPQHNLVDFSDYSYVHEFEPKYNCRQPFNFVDKSTQQMCNYKLNISPYIENKIQDFELKHVLKLDGRIPVKLMVHHIMERLLSLPKIMPVIIPEPLYLEESPESLDEFWKLIEESEVIESNGVKFNRYPSLWFNRCPVELKKRRSVQGKPKLAAKFFKHVYLLSTLDALILFCRNPRPYLKMQLLEPTCRMIVMGTKSSGKTFISHCLSWLFDAPIINYNDILERVKKNKYNLFSQSIFSEIIANVEDARHANWLSSESDRLSKLEKWNSATLNALKQYISLLMEFEAQQVINDDNDANKEERNHPMSMNLVALKDDLSYLPFLDDINECKNILKNSSLVEYAPHDLSLETEKPAIPTIEDSDVTEAIANYIKTNEIQKEIEPTTEEVMREVEKEIVALDEISKTSHGSDEIYGKYVIDGFPSGAEYWEHLTNSKLLPDNTVALIENKEVDSSLLKYYKIIENCVKNYEDRFIQANDPLVKIKLQKKPYIFSNNKDGKTTFGQSFKDILSSVLFDDGDNQTELIASFTQSIEKFREDWESIQLKLEDKNKSYIEVELGDKSDVHIVEEVLLKIRKSYYLTCELLDEVIEDQPEDENESTKDFLTYNDRNFRCETNKYCPIAYFDHGILREGNSEFCLKYDNKLHFFSSEECLEKFRNDVSKYQSYNEPFKLLPSLKICIIGSIGSGKTAISKHIAKELGLITIDFREFVNNCLIPKHLKKIGWQYENSFTDTPIDEEAVVEFQMGEDNENNVSDILSNETELRRMLFSYFEGGTPLMSALMQKFIKSIWFEEPYMSTGFVINGFPRLPSDVEDMIACFCIPDLVIELESSSELAIERVAPQMLKLWMVQQTEAKEKAKKKLEERKMEWMNNVAKNIIPKNLLNEVIDNALNVINRNKDENETPNEDFKEVTDAGSTIMEPNPSKLSIEDKIFFASYNEMILEYPEPVDETEWEKIDDIREKIDSRIESTYEIEDENVQAINDVISENKIIKATIDATKPLHKVLRIALSKLSKLRNRSESFFEQTFLVSNNVAERLLLYGFCFLSKFKRMCPVYIYDNPYSIHNPYQLGVAKDKIFTVIHRCYVYYIYGDEQLMKFRQNPLKFIISERILYFHEFPLSIGVIGPPKSGKSSLAAKLAEQYGLVCVSKGTVIRNVLENMHWTELASRMRKSLESGAYIDTDLIINAVQSALIDHRTLTYGFILDGLPESPAEATKLINKGLYPQYVFDLKTDKNKILENSQNQVHLDILKWLPVYSRPYIEFRFTKWLETYRHVRDYIKTDFQNLVLLSVNGSKWQCLQDANEFIQKMIPKINYYLNNVNSSIVPVDAMCISNAVFQERMSNYKNFCPACYRKNTIKHSNHPVDRRGIVEYNNKFYWICPEHMSMILKKPDRYLFQQHVDISEIPVPVKNINTALVYENGICIVTYGQNLPRQKIIRGNNNYAASFKGKIYLFCSAKCLEKFLEKPQLYSNITVFHNAKLLPDISLKALPNIGYLEQTVGHILTEACCSVNVLRPKYPGLSIDVSAALFIGLYLKIYNPFTKKYYLEAYKKAYKTYECRSKLILQIGLRLRSTNNPFITYPKCCKTSRKKLKGESLVAFSTVTASLTSYSNSATASVQSASEQSSTLL